MKNRKLVLVALATLLAVALVAVAPIAVQRYRLAMTTLLDLRERVGQVAEQTGGLREQIEDLRGQIVGLHHRIDGVEKTAGAGKPPSDPNFEALLKEKLAVGRDGNTRLKIAYYIEKEPDLEGTALPISIKRLDDGPLTPVSLTRIGPDQFLFVNYRNVYFYDEAKREARPAELDMPVPVWNPTAIHYSAFYDKVFIANYTGKDVIVAEMERTNEGVKLRLAERITHPDGIKGPEGVQVSPGGRFMAVADYDGAALSVFERVNDAWVYRWKKPVISSHGVAIVGRYVYGAGTTIAKFDIETGEELARVSKIGDEPILFAACISPDEKTGELVGSDTMAGRVFTMSRDLQVMDVFGANGPTHANLSMPYCAYRDGEDIYVLSTYQDRIIKIGKERTQSFEFGGPRWQYVGAPSAYRNPANVWSGPVKFDSPSYEMFGKAVRPSYGSLSASDGTTLYLPSRLSAVGNTWLFYVSTIASNQDWLAIVANSSPVALIYNRKTGALGSVEIGEWDCWASAASVLCPSRRYPVSELAGKATFLKSEVVDREQAQSVLEGAAGKSAPLIDYWRAWQAVRG